MHKRGLSDSVVDVCVNSRILVIVSVISLMGFPCGLASKESTCNAGDLGSIPGLGRSPGEGKTLSTPVFWPGEFHDSFAKSWTRLSDFHFHF